MKLSKRFLILLLILSCNASMVLVGQVKEESKTLTPYELLSSYYQNDFSPFEKKTWYLGAAFSLGSTKKTYSKGLLQEVIDGKSIDYSVALKGGYYSGDYNMIGLNLEYIEKKFTGTTFQDPDTIQSNSITRGYTITPNLRTSLPLNATERLSFFIMLGLEFGMGTTLDQDEKYVDQYTRKYSTSYSMGAGVSPGITFFAMENFAFEIQLNIFGYQIQITDTESEGQEPGRVVDQNLSFKIDLLTLELGLAYYFGAGK